MTHRYHLRNYTHVIEWEFRRIHAPFKRRKIRDVIQARPDLIDLGKVYART